MIILAFTLMGVVLFAFTNKDRYLLIPFALFLTAVFASGLLTLFVSETVYKIFLILIGGALVGIYLLRVRRRPPLDLIGYLKICGVILIAFNPVMYFPFPDDGISRIEFIVWFMLLQEPILFAGYAYVQWIFFTKKSDTILIALGIPALAALIFVVFALISNEVAVRSTIEAKKNEKKAIEEKVKADKAREQKR